MLPTLATDAAFCRQVMLSRMRPSPVTLTVNGLPVNKNKASSSLRASAGTPLHRKTRSLADLAWDVFLCKPDGDDVVSRFGGTVGDLTGPVLHVLRLDVHLTGTFDGQSQAAVTCPNAESKG